MRVRYVVLYVNDPDACRRFWIDQVGMVEKHRTEVGEFSVVQVGFADQPFAFELVPLAMMADNPYGRELGGPSIALQADSLEEAREQLLERGVTVAEIGEHSGVRSFAFSDPEDRWFAVTS
jgi:catechol 2,3-dioxygenase-like lactoylglutathione lyase family enzyme